MLALLDWLRDAVRAEERVAGVCFGHQAIARALGGRVERAGMWKVGPQSLTLDGVQHDIRCPLPADLAQPLSALPLWAAACAAVPGLGDHADGLPGVGEEQVVEGPAGLV